MINKNEIIQKYAEVFQGLGINLHTTSKDDLLSVLNFRCEHRHTAETHPACYTKSNDCKTEGVIAYDLETSNLHADFGIILSWCAQDIRTGGVFSDTLTLNDIKCGILDKRIVESCVETLQVYDRWVGQFSTYFDNPFLRTRAVKWGIPFPEFGQIWHTDVWAIAKRKLKLHSNRQGSIAETVLGHDVKTRIHPDIWTRVQFGSDKDRVEALAYVLDHNKRDVQQLVENYLALRRFVREGKVSI